MPLESSKNPFDKIATYIVLLKIEKKRRYDRIGRFRIVADECLYDCDFLGVAHGDAPWLFLRLLFLWLFRLIGLIGFDRAGLVRNRLDRFCFVSKHPYRDAAVRVSPYHYAAVWT